ncbi:cysteine-rich protein 1 isoform 1-T1 [Acanthopagrus schlegelii]
MVGYCPICGKPVYFGEKKRSLGRDYHPLCLKCQKCNRQLTAGQHAEVTGDCSAVLLHRHQPDPEWTEADTQKTRTASLLAPKMNK